MTLDEAIKHAEEVAEENEKKCTDGQLWDVNESRRKRAEEHRQFAEWLKELKQLKVGTKMTKEQKDKILKALAADRNDYAKECNRRIEREWGKIEGADYMIQRFLDVLSTEVEPQERSEE